MYGKVFKRLFGLFLAYAFLTTFSRSLLYLYYRNTGLTFTQIILIAACSFGTHLVLMLSLREVRSTVAWPLSLAMFGVFLSLNTVVVGPVQLYIGAVAWGASLYFFYTNYNVAIWESAPPNRNGFSAAMLTAVWPVLGIVAPPLSGLVAGYGYIWVWVVSAGLLVVTWRFALAQGEFRVKYSVRGALREIRSVRIFYLLEGVWQGLGFGVIPVYTLVFFKTPASFGTFLAFMAGIGAVTSLLFGRLTDRIKKRVVFFYPVTLALAGVCLYLPFAAASLNRWVIANGIFSAISPIFGKLTGSLIPDMKPDFQLAMPGREVMLGSGRLVGLGIAWLSFVLDDRPSWVFGFFAVVLLTYGGTMYWRKQRHQHEYF
jgi:MFS family permease